ncbi:hypothetical protein [Streptomyces sp. NBC_00316]|uniref:hypothetical protein n=1 Tax=Streptomyces sp. NBC_00316 TaxID=2975710 RepID=UPI002E2823E9|nr:hypothetical protein [Streptomyces sp. NBC_00316]
MRDDESVNDEDLEEADLLVECLPRGDLTGPEFVHHCAEPLKHVIAAKRDLAGSLAQDNGHPSRPHGSASAYGQPQDRLPHKHPLLQFAARRHL